MVDDDEPPIGEPPDEGAPPRRRDHLSVVKPNAVIPHNTEAEEAVLGGIWVRPELFEQVVAEGVTEQSFYRPLHRQVYGIMLELVAAGSPIDSVTMPTALERRGLDSRTILADLAAAPGVTRNIATYCRMVVDDHRLRTGLDAASQAVAAYFDRDEAGALRALSAATELTEATAVRLHSWQPVDLQAVLDGDREDPPTMLQRTDGQYLVYPGKVHAFNAESESGKSMVALALCAERMWALEHVLFVDFEDSPLSVVNRLLAMEVAPETIASHFHYIRPDDPIDLASKAHLGRILTQHQPTLAIIDGVTEVMTMNGWSLLDNAEIALFQRALPNFLADRGLAVVMIDHVPKNKDERGKGGIGGQHKRAGVDVGYILEVIKPFGRGLDGQVKLSCDKDRPGYVRAASVAGTHTADIHITSANLGGRLEVSVHAPPAASGEGYSGPTDCMAKVMQLFNAHPHEEISKNGVHTRIGAYGGGFKKETIGAALEALTRDGLLLFRNGSRGSHLYRRAHLEEPDDRLDI